MIALVGNKIDLEEKKQVSSHESREFCDEQGLIFYEVSAKSGANVQEVFMTIAKKLPIGNNEPKKVYLKSEKEEGQSNRKCFYCI